MTRILRAALTETCNAYREMPESVAELHSLAGRLDDVRQANLDHHVALVAQAGGLGVRLLCLGELFTAPYFALSREPMWRALSEDALEGPTLRTLRPLAAAHGMALVAPIYEEDSRTGRYFNTAVVIGDDGRILGRYRKTHIPEGSNEQGSFCETAYYERSDGELGDWPRNVSKNRFFPVFDTGAVRLGLLICYDRHFPDAVQALAQNGAELILCPAVTFGAKSRAMWDLEFPADAARHNLFIGGSNRRGVEPPWNQEYFGASYFVGPNGRLPAVPAPAGLVVADIDLDERVRPDPSGWNLPRDQRPDIY
ncbi:MAG: nitrilase-related carbon-nitrogen hydrolase [Vicinamibacteria bacterium]